MTSAGNRRLKRVEGALYPSEAMALWLHEAKEEHRSLRDLVERYKAEPAEAWPLFELTRQAEAAARGRLKSQAAALERVSGQRTDFLDRGERDAVRDVATLFYLFVEVNGRFMAEERALYLLVALLFAEYRQWVRDGELPERDEPLDRQLTSALGELYAWDDAVAALTERYFQGVNPLMPEVEESLDWIAEQAEQLAERFNEHLEFESKARKASRKRKPALPKPIDLGALREGAQLTAQAHANLLVDMARAEACEMMGERQRALTFAGRHVR